MGLPAETRSHPREALRLDEVVEGEGREHGAVAVDVGLDEEGGAADAVEVDFATGVAVEICRVDGLVGSFDGNMKKENGSASFSLVALPFFIPKVFLFFPTL